MQKRSLLLFIMLTGSILITCAQVEKQVQSRKGCSCSFSSINQAGILNGAKGAYYQLQTINGIKYKTWFAGIGVGVDPYSRTGYPLFFDLRKDFLNKNATPFLYADAGAHIVKDKNDQINNWYENVYRNGAYTDVGIGYKFPVLSKFQGVISAGYSYKYVERKSVFSGSNCPSGLCYDNYETYKSYLHRGTIKLGFQF
ncbi:MAG: hypothetical protein ACJ751_03690 [Niastella sp.]|uniref:hypothetical protein n=1 Tax=Niastella sp. TaxID=1869183 RepID=UPI00389ACD36